MRREREEREQRRDRKEKKKGVIKREEEGRGEGTLKEEKGKRRCREVKEMARELCEVAGEGERAEDRENDGVGTGREKGK